MNAVAVDCGREFDCGVCSGSQAQFGDLGLSVAPPTGIVCAACEIISKYAPLAGRKLCGGRTTGFIAFQISLNLLIICFNRHPSFSPPFADIFQFLARLITVTLASAIRFYRVFLARFL